MSGVKRRRNPNKDYDNLAKIVLRQVFFRVPNENPHLPVFFGLHKKTSDFSDKSCGKS
jgi:hypothetical protein